MLRQRRRGKTVFDLLGLSDMTGAGALISQSGPMTQRPRLSITYCRKCGWLLRASWMAQELLSTFAEELGAVSLIPDGKGGVFEVRVEDELIWSRNEQGGFPDIKVLKQLVRDNIAPDRELGHLDAT